MNKTIKMKYLLLLIVLPVISYSQDVSKIFPTKEGKVYYEKVVEIDGVTKDQLYSRAKAWALSHYGSQKDASQADDRDLGMLVYNGYFSEGQENPKIWGVKTNTIFQFWHNLKVYVKDGKAKIVIDKVQVSTLDGQSQVPSSIKRDIELFGTYDEELLKKSMVSKAWIEKFQEKTTETFTIANSEFLSTIDNIGEALKRKSESDF